MVPNHFLSSFLIKEAESPSKNIATTEQKMWVVKKMIIDITRSDFTQLITATISNLAVESHTIYLHDDMQISVIEKVVFEICAVKVDSCFDTYDNPFVNMICSLSSLKFDLSNSEEYRLFALCTNFCIFFTSTEM